MKIFQFIAGGVLLLPGICSIGFMIMTLPDMTVDAAGLWILWLPCLAVSALGVWMIRKARSRP